MKKPIANMKERSEEELQISRFKSEFLRRNPQYQKEYRAYAKDASREGESIQDWVRRVGRTRMEKSREEANRMRQKYGMNSGEPLLDPDEEFQIKPGMQFMPFVNRGVAVWTHLNLSGQDLKPTEMLFKVDLRYPDKNLFDDIKMYIQMEKQSRELKYQEKLQIEEALQKLKGQKGQKAQDKRLKLTIRRDDLTSWPEPPIQPPKRKQIKLYETYLVVWDLREDGKTFTEIAEDPKYTALLPSDKTDTQTVKTQYYTAKKLVEGGYKDI